MGKFILNNLIMEKIPTDSQVVSIAEDPTQFEGGEEPTRKINETIRYQATPLKPDSPFITEKFEPFKMCCGNCFHLDMTQAIIATYNPCCSCISRKCYQIKCPEQLKRMEHYCQNLEPSSLSPTFQEPILRPH